MQIVDGRFRGRDDVDSPKKEHQGKNSEPEDNFSLHRSVDRSIAGLRDDTRNKPKIYATDARDMTRNLYEDTRACQENKPNESPRIFS